MSGLDTMKGLESKTAVIDSSDDHGVTMKECDWTPEEERQAKRKLDMIIMPLLALGYFCLRKFDAPSS